MAMGRSEIDFNIHEGVFSTIRVLFRFSILYSKKKLTLPSLNKKEMTDNHTVVSPLSSVSFIDNLPSDKHVLHDIRFRFKVDNI